MPLSEDDKRRIEEEEYRRVARERALRSCPPDISKHRTSEHRVEVVGVGSEMYRDAKGFVHRLLSIIAILLAAMLLGGGLIGMVSAQCSPKETQKKTDRPAKPAPVQSSRRSSAP
jgi:hypothetical protein